MPRKEPGQKQSFIEPTSVSESNIPQFMEPHLGLGLESIGPEDVYPPEIRPDELDEIIRNEGFDEHTPLEMLLIAIIHAHPMSAKEESSRLADALFALIGKPKGRRPRSHDYDFLLDVAREYHRSTCCKEPLSLAEIITKVYSLRNPDAAPLRRHGDAPNPCAKRIANKFNEHKHLLLARVTRETDPDRMDQVQAIKSICLSLKKLGIDVDMNTIPPTRNAR